MPDSHEAPGERDRQGDGTKLPPSSAGDRAASKGREARRTDSLPSGVLAIAGLSSLAFAQPIYDILRRSPEFFAIRDLYTGDLLALVAALLVGPTLAFSAPGIVARFLRPSWTRWAIAPPIGLLAALIALQAVNGLAAAGALGVALLVWLGASWAYVRLKGARSFALFLSGAAVVVPALLILDGDVRRSATPPKPAAEITAPDTGARAPIVLVIFDEWSLTSILDRTGAIDRERLPNLAGLADQATWYPNATAAANTTELALPAILAGSPAKQGRLPIASEYPVNMFTVLAPSHDVFALEPITALCPPEVNLLTAERPAAGDRFGLLASDLSIAWLRLTLPAPWRERLPAVTDTWSGFRQSRHNAGPLPATAQPVQRAMFLLRNSDRAHDFRTFVEAIQAPPSSRPGFFFLHSLLPHSPWEYLPSGRRYPRPRSGVHGMNGSAWADDVWPPLHHRKRYLLQVEFVDLLIGELLDHLRSVGLFERSVVAIMADHGTAFRPGLPSRLLTAANSGQTLDVAAVPLVIKAPFQERPTVVDEIFPLGRLAGHLLELSGASPNSLGRWESASSEPLIVGKDAGEIHLPADRESWRLEALTEQARLLGEANDAKTIGVRPDLHGLPLTQFSIRNSEAEISIENSWVWNHVDSTLPQVPVLLEGILLSENLLDRDVAAALNGQIAATVRPHVRSDQVRITALLPESQLVDGLNQVDVFLIGAAGTELEQLTKVDRAAPGAFEIVRGEDGRPSVLLRRPADGGDAERARIVARGKAGLTGFLNGSDGGASRLPGWATDLRNPGDTLEIVAFLGDRQGWAGTTGLDRPDVAERYGHAHQAAGFVAALASADRPWRPFGRGTSRLIKREGIVAYALSRHRGLATRLGFSYRPIARKRWGREEIAVSDGRNLPITPAGGRFGGHVDVLTKADRRTLIEGWAADLQRREGARQIVIYRDGEFLGTVPARKARVDVAQLHEDEQLTTVGFSGRVPGAPDPANFSKRHRVFAIMLQGVAVELPTPGSTPVRR